MSLIDLFVSPSFLFGAGVAGCVLIVIGVRAIRSQRAYDRAYEKGEL